MTYSVRDEENFEPVYNEDEEVVIRKGDLRAILDVATQSMDFGSGFLDNEQVEALRKGATILGIDEMIVTPSNFTCQYKGAHEWVPASAAMNAAWVCAICRHTSGELPPPGMDERLYKSLKENADLKLELEAERRLMGDYRRFIGIFREMTYRDPVLVKEIENRLSGPIPNV